MAFGISLGNGEGGSFLPIIKFDARSGDLILMDKAANGVDWEEKDIARDKPVFAIDFGSIEVGWMQFSKPPIFLMAPVGKPKPARPEGDFREGIRVKMAGKALGGVREFSTTSKNVLAALEELHNAYEAAPEAADGQIPVVRFVDTKSVKVKTPQGQLTFKTPVLEIVQWVERNADMLGPRTVPPPGKKAAPAAVQGGSPLPPKGASIDEDQIPFAPEWR